MNDNDLARFTIPGGGFSAVSRARVGIGPSPTPARVEAEKRPEIRPEPGRQSESKLDPAPVRNPVSADNPGFVDNAPASAAVLRRTSLRRQLALLAEIRDRMSRERDDDYEARALALTHITDTTIRELMALEGLYPGHELPLSDRWWYEPASRSAEGEEGPSD